MPAETGSRKMDNTLLYKGFQRRHTIVVVGCSCAEAEQGCQYTELMKRASSLLEWERTTNRSSSNPGDVLDI